MIADICDCPIPNCGCAGGTFSFAPAYKRLLDVVQPKLVLEWGPGKSTVLALNANAAVISVEFDKKWVPEIEDNNWACVLVQAESLGYLHLWGASTADIFFVDSRRRENCMDVVRTCGKEDAIMVLHDAQRKRYQEALHRFPYVFFVDRGVAFASRSKKLVEIVDSIRVEKE